VLEYSVAWSQLEQVDHWESIIYPDQIWHYFPGTTEPPFNWKDNTFDAGSWATGPGGIGYGDEDDSTIIDPVISVYLRMKFNIVDTGNVAAMVFHMDYDDAFVAYINGIEIARSNISGSNPAYNLVAAGYHEATMYAGGIPEEFLIPVPTIKETLREGENILAVQVHNQAISSSDMSAIPFLAVGIRDTTTTYLALPEWFIPPIDYNLSELPIMSINTLGNFIVDDPRIQAWMGIIDNGQGELNHISDPVTGYNGMISIEIRGESAQMFPKKSYSFETQDSLGENNNVSLLGFPEENDWILYGPYSDKTLIKNVLTYKLSRDLGRYATRTKYVELFINGDYKGLYVLMEKIKRDKNRVDIASLREEDISGDQLTGGYIVRIDKVDDDDYPPWIAYPYPGVPNANPVTFQFFDPGGEELHLIQQDYIKNYIEQFESVLNSDQYLSNLHGYHQFIDKPALIDFLIINEISKNIDAYIFSTYMYKDRDSRGGKLTMGPAWDFNISYGNVDYNTFAEGTSGWMYNEGFRTYWFRRMMNDWGLKMRMSCRWHELRVDRFSDDKIFGFIDSLVISLQNPINKNYKKWLVLGQYVWPNSYIGKTHAEEIDYLKAWLQDRLDWMDANIPEVCITGNFEGYENQNSLNIYPNPFEDEIYFWINGSKSDPVSIRIFDYSGKPVRCIDQELPLKNKFVWDGLDSSGNPLTRGLYIVKIILSDGNFITSKIIKN
jgi:hypothetical protein